MDRKRLLSISMSVVWALGPNAGFASPAIVAPRHEAGSVLVFPGTIVDQPNSGTPPLPTGQDGDGFPDTDETVDLPVLLSNKSGSDLTNVVVRLWSVDARVDCVGSSIVAFGAVPAGATVGSPTPFRFRIGGTADRAGAVPPVTCSSGACSNGAGRCASPADCVRTPSDAYAARFQATVHADQLPPEGETDRFDVELDLDSSAPAQATSTWIEGFEAGMGGLTFQNLDANQATNALSDGKRCQYNDPDYPKGYSYGESECYLGFATGQSPLNDWHVHDTMSSDGGRAFLGRRSLHWGKHLNGVPGRDTYSYSQMDAVRTSALIHLAARVCASDPSPNKRSCGSAADCVVVGGGPCVAARPELSFKQQTALPEVRPGIGLDRAVVFARVTGSPIWQKLTPLANVYDQKVVAWSNACSFDPSDDGSTEDDFFQPGEPIPFLGPSSTCEPEFAFRSLGDTGSPFSPDHIGSASDGPGLPGSLGLGTWIESRFDLSRFRGRSIELRWLVTTRKVGDLPTWESHYLANPTPIDDGWFLDDIRVTQTLGGSSPAPALDSANRSSLPGCGASCSATAALVATPTAAPAPGTVVVVSAVPASLEACPGGAAVYQLWVDGNADGAIGGPLDWYVTEESLDPPVLETVPLATTHYGLRARCSTRPSCSADLTLLVEVLCPPAASFSPHAWWAGLYFFTEEWITFPRAEQTIDGARGLLSALRAQGQFGGEQCFVSDGSATDFLDWENPPAGDGFYYLARGSEPWCAETPTWRTYHPAENPSDPSKRDREITACAP